MRHRPEPFMETAAQRSLAAIACQFLRPPAGSLSRSHPGCRPRCSAVPRSNRLSVNGWVRFGLDSGPCASCVPAFSPSPSRADPAATPVYLRGFGLAHDGAERFEPRCSTTASWSRVRFSRPRDTDYLRYFDTRSSTVAPSPGCFASRGAAPRAPTRTGGG
jgi:hypothetical protein